MKTKQGHLIAPSAFEAGDGIFSAAMNITPMPTTDPDTAGEGLIAIPITPTTGITLPGSMGKKNITPETELAEEYLVCRVGTRFHHIYMHTTTTSTTANINPAGRCRTYSA